MISPAKEDPQYQRTPAHVLALWLAGPVAAILIVAIAAAAWVVQSSATHLDRAQLANEETLARTAFGSVAMTIERVAADYSYWDETYDQMAAAGPVDLEWGNENLGPYLSKTYGVTYVFVLDQKGGLRYASVPGEEDSVQVLSESAKELAGLDLNALRAAAVAAIENHDDPKRFPKGYFELGGVPAFASVHPIRPDGAARASKEPPRHALAIVKTLDAGAVAELSLNFGLADLRFANPPKLSLSPLNAGGRALGVQWSPQPHGANFLRESAGTLLPLVCGAALLILLAGVGWWRAFTSVRNAELQALTERAKAVQDTARAKSLFVANMSHELRTPLNAIIGFSELIKEQILGAINVPKYAEYAGDIHASGKHLLGIVNNILTLSKIEAQQQRIVIEDVNLSAAVSDALRMAMPDAAKRKVQIETAYAGAPLARADAQALTQIVVNLLSNAVKFSDSGGVVKLGIDTAAHSKDVTLTVSDDGCGIPAETLAQLGRPFMQAEDPYRRNYQGTGLGLSICFALARAMNGELRIESHEGRGTRAVLSLPAAQAANASPDITHAPRAA